MQNLDSRNHIRIFISSTFQDMQEEREELVKNVYPKLKEYCLKSGIHLTIIDLRWGITDEQAELGRVIPICFHEIDNCRPYFVGILGERYGWVPEQLDNKLVTDFSWLNEHGQISVTEMEIRHAVLNDPVSAPNALFYFRDPAYSNALADAQGSPIRDATLAEKLAKLKSDIRASGCPLHENYATPKALATRLQSDLNKILESEFPYDKLVDQERVAIYSEIMGKEDSPKGTPPETFRQLDLKQKLFENRLKFLFVGREGQLAQLDDFRAGNESVLVLHGPAGIGKSALVAHWADSVEAAEPQTCVAVCNIESRPSCDLNEALARIAWQIDTHLELGRQIDLNTRSAAVLQETLDAAAKRGPVIVVLDGLDHLAEESKEFAALSDLTATGARFVFTTRDPSTAPWHPGHSCRVLPLEGLSRENQRKLAIEYLGQFGKTLDDSRLNRVLAEEEVDNPLYLKTLLDEFLVFGGHEALDEAVDFYLDADSMRELYGKILTRLEDDFVGADDEIIPILFRSILLTRSQGLSEEEVQALLSLSPIRWSELYFACERLLKKENGFLSLRDSDITAVAEGRYCNRAEDRRATHAALAALFRNHPTRSRVAHELPYHLQRLEDWDALRDILVDLDLCTSYSDDDRREYWSALSGRFDKEAEYIRVVERIDSTEEAGQHTLFLLAGYLKSEGASEGAERVLRKAMELWRDREAEDPLISRVVLRDLAIVSMEGQRLDEASELLERALTLGEDADILTHLGLVAMRRGDPGQAEIHFRRASELSEDDPFCSDEYSAEILTLLGLTSAQLGRGEDAEVCYDRAIALAETPETVKAFAKFLVEQGRHRKAVGQWEQALQLLENGTDRDDAKIAPLRVNYIRALIAGGDLEKADEELSREIRGTEAAHGRDARVLVDWLYDRGGVLRDLYRYDQAAEQYDRAIAIQKLHNEEKSTYAASVLLERGWCYYRLGRYEEAEETYRQTLAIWDQADDSLNRAHTLRYVANLLAETGRVDEAAEHYQKALRTYENSDSDTDYHIAATLVGMGLMKNQTGERRSARELYRRALACFERLYGAKHLSVASVLANLGSSYLADERYVDAEEAYRRALTIFRTVSAGDEHPTIATIMNGLATALVHQDRPDEAEAFVPPPA